MQGYEIHSGQSEGEALLNPVIKMDNGKFEGAISNDQQVLGTYVHGVFDDPCVCEALLDWAGVKKIRAVDFNAECEQGIDLMADTVEQYIDMPLLEQCCLDFSPGKKKTP